MPPYLTALLLLMVVRYSISASNPPNWVANTNINCGQIVAFDLFSSNTYQNANNTSTKPQSYNASFPVSVTPTVIISLIGYGQMQPPANSLRLGFTITISNISHTSFAYSVTSYDLMTVLLHYNYMAMANQASTFSTDILYFVFNSSHNVMNPSAPLRQDTFTLAYPGGRLNSNYLNNDFRVMVFPIGFCLKALSSVSHFSINGTALNQTHYTLDVSTINNNLLLQIDFSIICFDRTAIQYNYTVYIDILLYNVDGNSSTNHGDNVSNNQYVYRNGLSGAVHVLFELNSSFTSPNVFLYSYSSTNKDLIVFRGFNYRLRQCPLGFNLYEPATTLCYDTCPDYTYPNSTDNLCISCHYSCSQCSAFNSSTNCLNCSSSDHRALNSNSSCECIDGYFEVGSGQCQQCLSTCLTCSHFNSCLTCDSSMNRVLSGNGSCVCNGGFYENTTCLSCEAMSNGCIQCSYSIPTQYFICQTCNASAHRILGNDNQTCLCDQTYYQDATQMCIKCTTGCLSCSLNSSQAICKNCNSSLQRIMGSSNLTCPCISSFYEQLNGTCSSCPTGCLSCYLTSTQVICSSCDSSLYRTMGPSNLTCPCFTAYYQNTTNQCQLCSINGCSHCALNASTSTQTCTVCDSSGNFILSLGVCVCSSNSILINSTCQSNSTVALGICGNGILQSGQQCDDNNNASLDGCSSTCYVQTDSTCIQNSTLYNYSLCYYNRQIALTPRLIYKVPFENKVKIQLSLQAPNCNLETLKHYLQESIYLKLIDKSRLLLSHISQTRQLQVDWSSIDTKSITFDPQTNTLTIVFTYNSDIDLTTKSIRLDASQSLNSPFAKYFYNSPSSLLSLSSPYNNLSTLYYDPKQLESLQNAATTLTVLLILYWIFIIIAISLKRGAIAVESMLLLQLTYLIQIDQPNILESYGALQLSGKYIIGFNVDILEKRTLNDLMAVNLDGQAINSFSIALSILIALFIGIVAVVISEHRKKAGKGDQTALENEEVIICKNIKDEQSQRGKLVKQGQVDDELSTCQKAFITVLLLISTTLVINLCFINSQTLIGNAITTVVYLAISVVFWVLWNTNKKKWSTFNLSFIIILNRQDKYEKKLAKLFISNYYLVLHITLVLIGMLMALMRTLGVAIMALIIFACLALILTIVVLSVYIQRIDKIRAIVNSVCLTFIMCINITIHSLFKYLSMGQALLYLQISLLFFIFTLNSMILIITQFGKMKKEKEKEQKVHETEMKEMINELGLANITFLEEMGYKSVPKGEDIKSGRIALLSEALNSSYLQQRQEVKLNPKLLEAMSELKSQNKAKNEGMANQLVDLTQCGIQDHMIFEQLQKTESLKIDSVSLKASQATYDMSKGNSSILKVGNQVKEKINSEDDSNDQIVDSKVQATHEKIIQQTEVVHLKQRSPSVIKPESIVLQIVSNQHSSRDYSNLDQENNRQL